MKNLYLLSLLLLNLLNSPLMAQTPQNPVVPSFGGIYEIPEASKHPDPGIDYNMVIDVAGGPDDPADLNRSLNNIARTFNLHVLGGVPKENIKIVAVLHALATPGVLSNESYRKNFGVDNPNDQLIRELTEAGAEIYVCGQSLIARDFYDDSLHPDIKVSISAMTILTEYQQKGYALLRF
ncbi:MAG: DsrE family protein [Cyclobacteriaceae bacterium]